MLNGLATWDLATGSGFPITVINSIRAALRNFHGELLFPKDAPCRALHELPHCIHTGLGPLLSPFIKWELRLREGK